MISVRPFVPADAPALAGLMMEMADFYGAIIYPRLSVPDDIIHRSTMMDIIVANTEDRIVGFLTCTVLYPVAGLLAFTYIQQIYVTRDARRLGVAKRLMAGAAAMAKRRGSTRLEWSTGHQNAAARAFYEALGAEGSDKVQYVLEGAALKRLSSDACIDRTAT